MAIETEDTHAETLTEAQLAARLADVTAQIVAIGKRIEALIAARDAGDAWSGNAAERAVLVEKRFHLYREEGMLRHRVHGARIRELDARRRAEEASERAERERAGIQAAARREAERVAREAAKSAREHAQKQTQQETGHDAFNRKVALEVERRLATAAATQSEVPKDTRASMARSIHEALLKGERALLAAGQDPLRPSHAAVAVFFNDSNNSVPAMRRAVWNEEQAKLGNPIAMTCEAAKARMALPKEERRAAVRTYTIDDNFDDDFDGGVGYRDGGEGQ